MFIKCFSTGKHSYYSNNILERMNCHSLTFVRINHKKLVLCFLTLIWLFSIAVPLMYYGLQHYLSLAGSLIFIPLIIVPTMGGTDVSMRSPAFFSPCNLNGKTHCIYILHKWSQKDTATVISTMMLVSGITTILHLYFGTRLPLVQGSSFVYLAPALVIMNAKEFRNLSEHVS